MVSPSNLRHNIAFLLPTELLYAIKSFISESDFRTNVCFYRADPRFAALYGREEDVRRYWEKLCVEHGIGCTTDEDPDANVDFWRDVAFECIDRDGWCTHPQCGAKRLSANKQELERTDREGCASSNQVFRSLGFRREPDDNRRALDDILLDFGKVEDEETPDKYLREHRIAYRSRATFPPIKTLTICIGDIEYHSQNVHGLTVGDVIIPLTNGYLQPR
ncbi:hypothetical protein K474DRAFT_1408927 [Panus rudis PR-1116 ss-1]|nr:hypothetical protein K474DRAFT_1408927 [Panus rudis PR-1116 ss-1]